MKCAKEDLILYAVTDRRWLNGKSLAEVVEESLKGGVTFLQLREKELDYESFLAQALEIKEVCRKYKVPFIVNDNVDVAVASDADGIHVGQEDAAIGDVRKRVGAGKIIGVSAQTVEQAVLAESQGADYLGVGAVFKTGSKADAQDVTLETLREICKAVSIPVVAIGGITEDNLKLLSGSGISGIAVISAIYAQPDIQKTSERLKEAVLRMVKE